VRVRKEEGRLTSSTVESSGKKRRVYFLTSEAAAS
jgi:hypothetical protein